MSPRLACPHCGQTTDRWDQPRLTVDAIVIRGQAVLLIERGNPPAGWAFPGGFVDPGETLEAAVVRELQEETGLIATSVEQFHTYSDPARDPRHHTVSTIFLVQASGTPDAGDDAVGAAFFTPDALPESMAFDHSAILNDVFQFRSSGKRPSSSP